MLKTLIIAGYEITLTQGKRYLASRPMASQKNQKFDVSIIENRTNSFNVESVKTIPGLSYDDANKFLAEFNNEEMSFNGREW